MCLDAATGRRKWHFQIAHHGIWDYDPASPPNLVTITVNGKRIDAVVQLTKQGFAFVFDRVTGTPVWPIEERPVPASDVPGEEAWPTQPFPTAPPPFSEQGMTLDDAFDLTPELKAQAQAALRKFRLGPLYTPPSMEGTVMRPGTIGGANWGGATFDAGSGLLVFKTTNGASIARIVRPDRSPANPRASEVDAELTGDLSAATTFVPEGKDADGRPFPPLPLLKPPYGHVVAIDLNRGAIAWRVPFGDNPQLRSHPALKDLALPDQLGVGRRGGRTGHCGRARVRRRQRHRLPCARPGERTRVVADAAPAARDGHADDLPVARRRPVRARVHEHRRRCLVDGVCAAAAMTLQLASPNNLHGNTETRKHRRIWGAPKNASVLPCFRGSV